jgi:cytochrome oxidase Cu insertion factor (SCO1/SenC/PrrC family)
MKVMSRPFLYALTALLTLVLGVIAWRLTPTPGPTPVSTGTALVGGPFALIDQAGKPKASGDFRGRYMLIYFGFTTCPDICPTELTKIGGALTRLEKSDADKAKQVQPIFITVDPERDTPAVMGQYVANFHPRLIGLTGSPEQINAVMTAYRVYARKNIPKDDPKNYMMDHTSLIYLIGPDGLFIEHYSMADTVAQIAQRLEKAVQ